MWPPVASRARVTVRPSTATTRLGVADPARREAGQLGEQAVVDVGRGQGEVEVQGRARVPRLGRRREGQEPLPEGRPVLRGDLEAGGPGVAAVADQEVAAGGDGVGEVERAVAAARDPDDGPELRPDERGPAALLGQAAGHEADDPDRPRSPDDRRRRVVDRVGRGPGLGEGGLHLVAPGHVGGLEQRGQRLGLGRVLGEEEPGGVEGLPHPPGGVQARREDEADRLDVDRLAAPTPAAARSAAMPGRGAGPDAVQAEADDRPVLAEDRGDVGDGPDRREIGQPEARRAGRRAGAGRA